MTSSASAAEDIAFQVADALREAGISWPGPLRVEEVAMVQRACLREVRDGRPTGRSVTLIEGMLDAELVDDFALPRLAVKSGYRDDPLEALPPAMLALVRPQIDGWTGVELELRGERVARVSTEGGMQLWVGLDSRSVLGTAHGPPGNGAAGLVTGAVLAITSAAAALALHSVWPLLAALAVGSPVVLDALSRRRTFYSAD